ncbi:retrovirus-related pol polyprotein from transposon TNT 1-94 [Tanacetum coccineum]
MPKTNDPINTMNKTNVSQSVVDENLPQLLDSKGGFHVTNVPAFDGEDFTNIRKSSLSLQNKKGFTKGIWRVRSAEEKRHWRTNLKNQGFGLGKSEKGKNEKGKSEKGEGLIALLSQIDWDEESVSSEDEKTTRIKAFMAIVEDEPSVEKANARYGQWVDITLKKVHRLLIGTSNESMADLNAEYHEQALMANKKSFYKRSGRRIDDMTKGKSEKGKKEKEKSEKGLIAESFDWDDESVFSNDEGTTKNREFMAITQDEPLVGKADERSGKWVDITIKKYLEILSKALGGKGRRKEKISSKEVVFTKADESSSMLAPEITSHSESECDTQEPLPPLPKLIGAAPIGTSGSLISLTDLTLNMADLSLDTYVPKKTRTFVKVLPTYVIKKKTDNKLPAVPELCPDKKADSSTEQLLLTLMEEVKGLKKQIEIPSGTSPSNQSSSKFTKQKTWFGPCKHCGFKNHLSNDCYAKPKCSTCGSSDHLTKEHLEHAGVKKYLIKFKAQSPLNPSPRKAPMIPKPFKEGKYCRFNDHHSDHCEFYPGCEVCGSIAHEPSYCPKKHPNSRRPRIANRQSEPMEKWVHKRNKFVYSKESGPKVVFRDDSSGDIEGYGSVNCNGITFTRVAYVNGLKHNLISISCVMLTTKFCLQRLREPFTTKMMKLSSFLPEEEMSMSLICHLLTKKAMPVSLPRPLLVKMENLNEVRVKELRSDNGIEFRNHKLEEFCDEKACPEYFPYIPAYENTKPFETPILQIFVTSEDPPEFTNVDDHPALSNHNQFESADHLESAYNINSAEYQDTILSEPISDIEPSPIILPLAEGTLQSLVPQDRRSREKHIELVNIIGEPLAGITTRSKVRDSEAASAHECLYVNFISEMEPKKLTKALEEEGWIIAMQEEMTQFERNKGYNQQEGIDYEETFAPVARLEAIRIFLLMQPTWILCEFPNHVCKLDKALYGLKKAPRAWYETLSKFLIQYKFVRGTPNLGLWYPKGSGFDLKAYSNSDYAGCNLDRKRTSGGCQILRGKLVCWSAKKQSSVAMSSAEAEYVAAVGCYAQVLWIKSQLADYDILYDKVNEATKTITFSLSWCEKPLTIIQDEFISAIGLPICKDDVPLPPKETIRAGLGTLGLFDKDKPTLSSSVLGSHDQMNLNEQTIAYCLIWGFEIDIEAIIFSDLVHKLQNRKKNKESNISYTIFLSLIIEKLLGEKYISNDLTLVKPHTISAASFQKPLASEVPLTSHMLKVAKLSEVLKESLIPPSFFRHLIRDCNYHENRLAKKAELNKQKGNCTGLRENKPVWNNTNRVNQFNKFVPTAVLTRAGIIPVNTDGPQRALKNKGIIDSCCSRHMTGNKAYLAEYEDYNGGPVAFGELQQFNLFSVSQICDKKNKVHFTDTECLVLSPEFKLPDENQDETSGILQDFIRQIENQLNHKVKTIRSDNGTEFKNREMIEFCGSRGIKREYSNARTPQQNGVAERKNRTLIEAARTMLADSLLPNTFWAKAVNTACYVLNRVLVTKPQYKTP